MNSVDSGVCVCAVQASHTLGGRSGKGGPAEGLFGSSDLSLSKNQDGCGCLCWGRLHGDNISGPGNFFFFFLMSFNITNPSSCG